MGFLEEASTNNYNCFFVDLFVRVSNRLAQLMYNNLSYVIYRQVLMYYSGEEDAYDMRKALVRDTKKESTVPLSRPIEPSELEWS